MWTLGIVAVILGTFIEKEEYKVLKRKPLLFDYEYFKELSNEYNISFICFFWDLR